MPKHIYTTESQVRTAFWQEYPELSDKKIKGFMPFERMYTCDTRTAFVNFVDNLSRAGYISLKLTQAATLETPAMSGKKQREALANKKNKDK